MVNVIKAERNADDHAGVRQSPTLGTRFHEKIARAAVPDPDDSDRTMAFSAGADPGLELRSSVAHLSARCDECSHEDDSRYSQAAARGRPEHRYVTSSRLIEGPGK